ncbi:hypothetical protein ACIPUD_39145 [Bradyrhizobium sp. CAR08]
MTERVFTTASRVTCGRAKSTNEYPVVKHQPNISSGGQVSYTDIGECLRSGAGGPERQQLLKSIDTVLHG